MTEAPDESNAPLRDEVRSLFPFIRYRGDRRERFFALALHESSQEAASPPALASLRMDSEATQLFDAIAEDHFIVEHSATARELYPFETTAAVTYLDPAKRRPKIFGGLFLLYLARDPQSGQPDLELLDALFAPFNNRGSMSVLEEAAASHFSRNAGTRHSSAATLADAASRPGAVPALSAPILLPDAHLLFARDIRAVAESDLVRTEKVRYLLMLVYLHTALFYWRLGFVLERGRQRLEEWLTEALADGTVPPLDDDGEEAFNGALRFRVATGARPVRQSDPCAETFRALDERALLMLPVNVTLLALLRASGGIAADGATSFEAVSSALANDTRKIPEFLRFLREHALSLVAPLDAPIAADLAAQLERGASPLGVAAEAMTAAAGSADLRRVGRQITSAVLPRGRSGLVAVRGRVTYFELGQDLVLLLAKATESQRTSAAPQSYREFLTQLGRYGLAPQDSAEERRLLDAMRALSLVETHSDAGEAIYVRNFL